MKYKQYAGSAWDELKHISQAVGFLVCNYKLQHVLCVYVGMDSHH